MMRTSTTVPSPMYMVGVFPPHMAAYPLRGAQPSEADAGALDEGDVVRLAGEFDLRLSEASGGEQDQLHGVTGDPNRGRVALSRAGRHRPVGGPVELDRHRDLAHGD